MIGRPANFLVAACVLVFAANLSSALARAEDQGGDGDATTCVEPYAVASRPIVGERGSTAGKVIGNLELRWSWSCHANWSRVVLYGGMYSSPVTVEQEINAEGRVSRSGDYNVRTGASGTAAWTRYLRLSKSESTACVSAHVSSDFGTLNFHTVGANFCV